jgi:4-amino-4-deoxy-L-arabinose transferase-like glycosyltransferase
MLAKFVLAARVPVFVDEAFYAWEARHPAWAYSDLPGLSAFLARLGLALDGGSALALRLPFLLLGAAVPWLVLRIARRCFGPEAGWCAGLLAVLLPLSGALGVLALPDVPLVFAALLCLDAFTALRERVAPPALLQLAAALALGALAHYRFAAVVLAGLAGVLLDARARRLLREPRVWLALAAGALAWWPLLQWNLAHAGAGLRFQLLERNPWAFHLDGLAWLPVQLLLVTPALFVLLLAALRHAWRERDSTQAPWGLLAGVGGVAVLGWFVLGFFADSERVSFHWPLAGWLALAVAAPALLARWRPAARAGVWLGAALGLVLCLGFLALAAAPRARVALAAGPLYPKDFAGWNEVADWVRSRVPPGAPIVASDFELGAQLAFALGRDDIEVLDSPLNAKHGRAVQLRLWGRELRRAPAAPAWFVVDDGATPLKHRLREYQRRCVVFGALPPPAILNVDHGRKRYLLYHFDPRRRREGCVAPALAYLDTPASGQRLAREFAVAGWAFKDGAGIGRVEVLLDGEVVALARYGRALPGVAEYWRISTDPAHPRVGFDATVDARAFAPGRHWLGLRLHGRDGSVEDWPAQPVELEP